MHTLPGGFVRIRYYAFLATHRYRNERLDECRRLSRSTGSLLRLAIEPQGQDQSPYTRQGQSNTPHLLVIVR